MAAARFVVRGVVQGVGFRWATVAEAGKRGLTGRVWNRGVDAVELVAEGSVEAIDDLERWLRRGPRGAEVRTVQRSALDPTARHRDFAIAEAAEEF